MVVGAGAGILALASALRRASITAEDCRRGWTVEPIGAANPVPERSSGIARLGRPAAAARANPIARQRFLDHRGRPLADIDLDRIWDGVGGCVAIHRATLHGALRRTTADVPVRFGTSVTDRKTAARRG